MKGKREKVEAGRWGTPCDMSGGTNGLGIIENDEEPKGRVQRKGVQKVEHFKVGRCWPVKAVERTREEDRPAVGRRVYRNKSAEGTKRGAWKKSGEDGVGGGHKRYRRQKRL